MPESRQRWRSSVSAPAVIAMIGIREPAVVMARMALVASYPSMTGIWQSIRIASKPVRSLATTVTPAAPSSAITTV